MNTKLDGCFRRLAGCHALATLALLLVAAKPAVAEDQVWRYFVYSISEFGTVTIWDNLGVQGAVTLPGDVNGLPVVRVGNGTFAFDYDVTSVTIPSPVAAIETAAFYHCVNLKSITLPISVSSIEPGAFDYCISLRTISVDPRNPYYSTVDGALFNKDQTTLLQFPGGSANSYVIPDSVTRIDGYAFAGLYRLTNVVIPASVTEIGSSAFYLCAGLTSITLPEGLTVISTNLFQGCSKLTSITIPDSVAAIQARAFEGCTGLTNVTLGRRVVSIESDAFKGCTSLTSITVPDNVLAIGDSAFANCTSLTNVTIGDGVTAIGTSAFAGCSRLADIRIGRSAILIGEQSFTGCSNLRAITVDPLNPAFSSVDGVLFNQRGTVLIQYPTARAGRYTIPDGVETIGPYAFDSAAGLTSITFPDSVTNIESFAFYRCTQIANITLPAALLSIGRSAFNYCSLLTGAYFMGNEPSVGQYALGHDPKSTIYFLDGTTGWNTKFGGRPTKRWYPDSTQLQVITVGQGTLSPNYRDAMLRLGSTNSMTAAGASGYAFQKWIVSTNWGDGVTFTNARLTFVMQSNLTITAIFIPASYAGLFMPSATGDVAATNSGSATFSLTDSGTLSGKLILAGKSISFSGRFSVDGHATITVPRSGNSPLTLDLHFDVAAITGTVSASNSWSADLLARPRAMNSSSAFAGLYSMLFMGDHGAVDGPPGDSPMSVSVTAPYSIKVSGTMADGSSVNVTATLTAAADGAWPFYASLYSGKGLAIGWMSCASNSATPVLQWVKAPDAVAKYYPAGFSRERMVALQRYVAPKSPQNALGWTNGHLFLGGGNLAAPLEADVMVANSQIKSVSGTVSNLSLTITSGTGLFSGSFMHPVTLKKVTIKGGVVQGLPWVPPAAQVGVGGGWFPGTNQYGSVWIEPKP